MSRQLPVRPSLEHLRKHAKERLRELQQRRPDAKLADALHIVAREYGFATWPALKAHVTSLEPAAPHPLAGTWIANIARSRRHPANQFQGATLELTVDGDTVTIVHAATDERGRDEGATSTVQADGREHPSPALLGHALVAKWRGPRVLEVADVKDGQIVGGGTYEVSDDGRTLTVSSTRGEQVIVLDRV